MESHFFRPTMLGGPHVQCQYLRTSLQILSMHLINELLIHIDNFLSISMSHCGFTVLPAPHICLIHSQHVSLSCLLDFSAVFWMVDSRLDSPRDVPPTWCAPTWCAPTWCARALRSGASCYRMSLFLVTCSTKRNSDKDFYWTCCTDVW